MSDKTQPRILGRSVARELTKEELNFVSGGLKPKPFDTYCWQGGGPAHWDDWRA